MISVRRPLPELKSLKPSLKAEVLKARMMPWPEALAEGMRLWLVIKLSALTYALTLAAYVTAEAIRRCGKLPKGMGRVGRVLKALSIPPQASPALLLAPLGARGMHAYLATLYRRGEVRDGQVLTFTLLTSPAASLNLLLRFSFPIALATLGPCGALLYLAVAVTPSAVRAVAGAAYGLWRGRKAGAGLKEGCGSAHGGGGGRGAGTLRPWGEVLRSGSRVAALMSLRLAAVFMIVNLLAAAGAFTTLAHALKPYLQYVGLSPAASAVLVTAAVKPSVALMTLGALVKGGALTLGEGLTALVIGRLAYLLVIEAWRAVIPFYSALYRASLALKVFAAMALTQAASLPLQLLLIKASQP